MSAPKVIVPKGLYKRLKHLSKTSGRSPQYHLALALQDYLLNAEEDKQDLGFANRYLKKEALKIKKGSNLKTVPFPVD